MFLHIQGDLFNWPICRLHHHKTHQTTFFFFFFFFNKSFYCLEILNRSQYLFKNYFFDFYIRPGQISEKKSYQMIILAVLSENTVQCPKSLFSCLLYIYTFSNFQFLVPRLIPRYQDFWICWGRVLSDGLGEQTVFHKRNGAGWDFAQKL